MKKVISILYLVIFCLFLTACEHSITNESKESNRYETPKSVSTEQSNEEDLSETLTMIDLRLTVGNKVFSAKFYENQTTQALIELFPLTIDMSELNGNEKYYYLSNKLPSASEQPGEIHAGDIMLYGNDCLVIFYKTFSSSYQYTRLGYVEDADSFAQAVADGITKVTFDLGKHEKNQGE
jgi:hypothetical protein